MILVWNGPRQTLSHTITSSSMLPSGGSPLAPSTGVCPLRGGDSHTPPAEKKPCHPHSGPWHGEMVYLALSDNIDYSVDRAGPYNQGDPPSKLGLIRHHQEHCIFIISCNPLHLHVQDDKPEWTSTFPT